MLKLNFAVIALSAVLLAQSPPLSRQAESHVKEIGKGKQAKGAEKKSRAHHHHSGKSTNRHHHHVKTKAKRPHQHKKNAS